MEYADSVQKTVSTVCVFGNIYKTCSSDKKTMRQCIKNMSIKEGIKLVQNELSSQSQIINRILLVPETIEYMKNCSPNHKTSHCVVGSTVNYGVTKAVNVVSNRLIKIHTPVTFVAGVVGKVIAKNVGKISGDLSVKLVDYLTEHVPAKIIDTSQQLTVQQNDTSIVFHPKEVKFIQQLVNVNQEIASAAEKLIQKGNYIEDDFQKYFDKNKSQVIEFNKYTNNVKLNITDAIDEIKQKTIQEQCKQINTVHLSEKLKVNYSDAMNNVLKYNNDVSRNFDAHLNVNNRSSFEISFSINYSPRYDGFHNFGGGFSCTLL